MQKRQGFIPMSVLTKSYAQQAKKPVGGIPRLELKTDESYHTKVLLEDKKRALKCGRKIPCQVRVEGRVAVTHEEVKELLEANSLEPGSNPFQTLCLLGKSYKIQFMMLKKDAEGSDKKFDPQIPMIQVPDFPMLYTKAELNQLEKELTGSATKKSTSLESQLRIINSQIPVRIFARSAALVLRSQFPFVKKNTDLEHLNKRETLWFSSEPQPGANATFYPITLDELLEQLTFTGEMKIRMPPKSFKDEETGFVPLLPYLPSLQRILERRHGDKEKELMLRIRKFQAGRICKSLLLALRSSELVPGRYEPFLQDIYRSIFYCLLSGAEWSLLTAVDQAWFDKVKSEESPLFEGKLIQALKVLPRKLIDSLVDFVIGDKCEGLEKVSKDETAPPRFSQLISGMASIPIIFGGGDRSAFSPIPTVTAS